MDGTGYGPAPITDEQIRNLFDQHLAVIRELADNVKALTERLIQVNNRVIELERRNNKIVHYPHR